jgi:hypothetical protein
MLGVLEAGLDRRALAIPGRELLGLASTSVERRAMWWPSVPARPRASETSTGRASNTRVVKVRTTKVLKDQPPHGRTVLKRRLPDRAAQRTSSACSEPEHVRAPAATSDRR